MASKFAGNAEPYINKISFDKKAFKDFPAKFNSPTMHPLVTRQSTYKMLLTAIASDEKSLQRQCFRNIKFEIMKNGARTEEAMAYLDDNNEFVFNGVKLTDEPKKTLVKLAENLPGNYTAAELMEIFGKFDPPGRISRSKLQSS